MVVPRTELRSTLGRLIRLLRVPGAEPDRVAPPAEPVPAPAE